MDAGVRETVNRVARQSYGRLLAFLTARSRDIASSEDALAEAFSAALAEWPRQGIPEKPEAWLLTVARRRLVDGGRAAARHGGIVAQWLVLTEEAASIAEDGQPFPDERLALMLVCAHPAINPSLHAPLMLQTVLGLDAARIASTFVVKPATMGQRLSRAKDRIRQTGLRFEVPAAADLAPRLGAVLSAIYAAYGSGWAEVVDGEPQARDLSRDAIELGEIVVGLCPEEPEAIGLLALMQHCEARRGARYKEGRFVPLSLQDTALWSAGLIAEAERNLHRAARFDRIGRFQIEAAIQSVHAQRRETGRIDWTALSLLYEGLIRLSPTLGALVARAAVVAALNGPRAALRLLDDIDRAAIATYQPYWAVRAALLRDLGEIVLARSAYDRAIGLCADAAMRAYLVDEARWLS